MTFLFFYPKTIEHRRVYVNCLVLVGVFCSTVVCVFVPLYQGRHRKLLSASSCERCRKGPSIPPHFLHSDPELQDFGAADHKHELTMGIGNKLPDTDVTQINRPVKPARVRIGLN